MCGITGHINFSSKNKLDQNTLSIMISSMEHRGPDDDGSYIHNDSQIGMRRLSIIDTLNGAQPIYSDDNQVVIIMNGEIFNYQNLKIFYVMMVNHSKPIQILRYFSNYTLNMESSVLR